MDLPCQILSISIKLLERWNVQKDGQMYVSCKCNVHVTMLMSSWHIFWQFFISTCFTATNAFFYYCWKLLEEYFTVYGRIILKIPTWQIHSHVKPSFLCITQVCNRNGKMLYLFSFHVSLMKVMWLMWSQGAG